MRDQSCKQIKADLTDYMNADLEAADSQRIRFHLSNCASCESFLVSLESVDTLVDDDPRVEPSADLQSRFMIRLEEHRANSGTVASAFGWWQSLVQWSLPRQVLAAGVLASLVVVVFYGGSLTQAPSPSSSEALMLTEMPMVKISCCTGTCRSSKTWISWRISTSLIRCRRVMVQVPPCNKKGV